MPLSDYVKDYRTNHKMSLRTFASKCGCSYQYIDKIEKGQIEKPSADMLQKIAGAMGVPIREILPGAEREAGGETEEAPPLPDHFDTPEQAVLWLTDLPVLAFYGGGDIQNLEPKAQLEFAREVLEYMKYLSGRKKGVQL